MTRRFTLYVAEHGVYHSKNSHVTIDVAAESLNCVTAAVGWNKHRTHSDNNTQWRDKATRMNEFTNDKHLLQTWHSTYDRTSSFLPHPL